MFDLKRVIYVGFDLDETLYESNPVINNRIRSAMANEIRRIKPNLRTLGEARQYFEERYTELQSGRKVLIEAGFSQEAASSIADRCVSQADILDILQPDKKTVDLIGRVSQRYLTYLLTSSPKEIADKKLEAIGIKKECFKLRLYGDTPEFGSKQEGDPFRLVLSRSNTSAENHVYVGNSKKADILPAKQLGMQTIAVWSEIQEADISIQHIHKLEGVLL